MCVIALKLKGIALPKESSMKNCEDRNKDGIGIALYRDGANEILIKKDFKDADALNVWLKENVKLEDTCMMHFRYATHGLKDCGNRHPFPVTKNKEMMRQTELVCQMAVVHNGVISQYGNETKFSDTQQFVMDILAEEAIKNNLQVEAVQKLIGNYIEQDRLAIMLPDGIIYTWNKWIEFEGIYYSNDSYEEHKPIYLPEHWRTSPEGKKTKWTYQATFEDFCDGCGQKKKIQMIEDSSNFYWNLCKPCRKKWAKGKLQLTVEGSLNELREDTKQIKGFSKEKSGLEECHNCMIECTKEEMRDYYGSRLCINCFGYYTNLITSKYPAETTIGPDNVLPKHYRS